MFEPAADPGQLGPAGAWTHTGLFSVPSPGVMNSSFVRTVVRAVCPMPFGTITNTPGSRGRAIYLASGTDSTIGVPFCDDTKIVVSVNAVTSCSSPGLVNR